MGVRQMGGPLSLVSFFASGWTASTFLAGVRRGGVAMMEATNHDFRTCISAEP